MRLYYLLFALTFIFTINTVLHGQSDHFKANGNTKWKCGKKYIDSRDGKKYKTVMIGTQCWFRENLNTGEMINGSLNMNNNQIIEKYCYDNNPRKCKKYGGLYQWNEIMNHQTKDTLNGICPVGWHIPSKKEWKLIEIYINSQSNDFMINSDTLKPELIRPGYHLKSKCGWFNKGNGSDLFRFSAKPAGIRLFDNEGFGDIKKIGFYWTSNIGKDGNAWQLMLDYSSTLICQNEATIRNGRSVRCVKTID